MRDNFALEIRLEEDMSAAKGSVHSVVICTDRPPSPISLVVSLIAGSSVFAIQPIPSTSS